MGLKRITTPMKGNKVSKAKGKPKTKAVASKAKAKAQAEPKAKALASKAKAKVKSEPQSPAPSQATESTSDVSRTDMAMFKTWLGRNSSDPKAMDLQNQYESMQRNDPRKKELVKQWKLDKTSGALLLQLTLSSWIGSTLLTWV